MKTLEDIYQRVVAGTAAGSHNLTPASSPAGTMHTLDDIYTTLPTNDKVLYGTNSGTANTPPGSGTEATANQVISGYYAFKGDGTTITGSATAGGVPKTGQTTSYADYDDGYYEKGLPTSGAHYTNNGDGTITDNATGLEWVADPTAAGVGGTYSWADAITACEGLTYAGHSDWRLPNVKELQSIVDFSRVGPAIDTTYFTSESEESYAYWSSTTYASSTDNAWYVDFYAGLVNVGVKAFAFYGRPVRGG
jgi:hypothetical protein